MRVLAVACLVALVASAFAGWGAAGWCLLPDGRFVIVHGTERFVLRQNAAWDIGDSSRKKALTAWIKANDLPIDLGQLVHSAPKTRELAFLGEVEDLTDRGAVGVRVSLPKLPKIAIHLVLSGDGALPDAAGRLTFDRFAKGVGMAPPSLLVALSGVSGNAVPEAQAWKALLKRVVGKEFFVHLPSVHGIVQGLPLGGTLVLAGGVGTGPSPTGGAGGQAPASQGGGSSNGQGTPSGQAAKRSSGQGVEPALLWVGIGLGGVLIVAAGASVLRTPSILARLRGGPKTSPWEPVFRLSAHERELMAKVRDEVKAGKFDPRAPDPEGFVVGKMMERYDEFERVRSERDALESYRKFKEETEAVQNKLEAALADVATRDLSVSSLQTELRQDRERLATLQRELEGANNSIRELDASLKDAYKLLEQFDDWCQKLNEKLGELG